MEKFPIDGHAIEVSPLKRVLLRTIPELGAGACIRSSTFSIHGRATAASITPWNGNRAGARRATLRSSELGVSELAIGAPSRPLNHLFTNSLITIVRENNIGGLLADHVNRADDKVAGYAGEH